MHSPSKGKKSDTEDELDGLKLAMNNLVESHIRGQTGGSGQYQYGKVQDLGLITCFRCHKKCNFQDNLPLAKKEGASSRNKETPATGSVTSTTLRYKTPENGYPNTKVVNYNNDNFSKNADNGTQAEAGNPQMITRQIRSNQDQIF